MWDGKTNVLSVCLSISLNGYIFEHDWLFAAVPQPVNAHGALPTPIDPFQSFNELSISQGPIQSLSSSRTPSTQPVSILHTITPGRTIKRHANFAADANDVSHQEVKIGCMA